jgi:hypothetical protein
VKLQEDSPRRRRVAKDRYTMDIALMLSGFSGLVAAFVASALWATRPTPLSTSRLKSHDQTPTRPSP